MGFRSFKDKIIQKALGTGTSIERNPVSGDVKDGAGGGGGSGGAGGGDDGDDDGGAGGG